MSSNQDVMINVIQSSTRSILDSFNEKTNSLSASYKDIGQLMRVGYDTKIAFRTAKSLFGNDTVEFLAIDGTMSEDQKLDMLVFYTAAFGYTGKLEFSDTGCVSSEPVSIEKNDKDISAAIPIHEADAGDIMGIRKEGDLEIDIERLPSVLSMRTMSEIIAPRTRVSLTYSFSIFSNFSLFISSSSFWLTSVLVTINWCISFMRER